MSHSIRFYNNQPVRWEGSGVYIPNLFSYQWDKSDVITPETVFIGTIDVFHWNVVIQNSTRGYFEHPCGSEGTLTIHHKTVTDFDGVFELPREVVLQLRMKGYQFEWHVLPKESQSVNKQV